VNGPRRLSQAIAEGDGISVLAEVRDPSAARAAEEQGAEGLVLRGAVDGVREASSLPLLLYGTTETEADVDAIVLAGDEDEDESLADLLEEAAAHGVECVLRVDRDDELERLLETVDPEIFLLTSVEAEEGQAQLERLLELLTDVPAGKLAIAELPGATPDEVSELERAGFDAVLVAAGDVASLVGESHPDV
jgi:hypothetical protein